MTSTNRPNLSGLLPLFSELTAYRRLSESLRAPWAGTRPLDVPRAARPCVAAALSRDLDRPLLYVAARLDRAQLVHETLRAYMGDDRTLLRFPEPAALFYERAPWANEVVAERLNVLSTLAAHQRASTPGSAPPSAVSHQPSALVIVASARALMFRTLPPRNMALGTRTLKQGQALDLDKTLELWTGLGYAATTTVIAPGEFSRRGGILDVWPQSSPAPARIELFGDEIESLRRFDPATQRSREKLEAVAITPASEALARFGPAAADRMGGWSLAHLPGDIEAQFARDRVALAAGAPFRGIEFYLPYFYPQPASLVDYLAPDTVIAIDDASENEDTWSELEEQAVSLRRSTENAGALPPGFPLPYLTWQEWRENLSMRSVISLAEAPPADEIAQLRPESSKGRFARPPHHPTIRPSDHPTTRPPNHPTTRPPDYPSFQAHASEASSSRSWITSRRRDKSATPSWLSAGRRSV